jgi:DNA invertase Pin-like site-specific DNA recombinase
MQLNLTGIGGIYLRVSEHEQVVERQRVSTNEWLVRHGASVSEENVFVDVDWKRYEADVRPDFQRMLKAVSAGRIRWIVVDDLDRFGTKNKHQLLHFIYMLQEAGCRLFSVDDTEWTALDLPTLLKAAIEGEKSEGEGIKRGNRVIEAMRVLAKKGVWMGGRVAYGFDVVCYAVDGNDAPVSERWRLQFVNRDLRIKITPDGKSREYPGRRNYPAREKGELPFLRPTLDDEQLRIIVKIFEWFATEAINPTQIATRLNSMTITPPGFAEGWSGKHVQYLLSNPANIGRPAWNQMAQGEYIRFANGRRQEKQKRGQVIRNEKRDWILPDANCYDPLIPLKLWDSVQTKLEGQGVGKRTVAPRSSSLWMAGLVFCGNCGTKMHGNAMKNRNGSRTPTYFCGAANTWHGMPSKCPCKMYRVRQSQIEKYLNDYFNSTMPFINVLGQSVDRQKPKELEKTIREIVEMHRQMLSRVQGDLVDLDGEKYVSLPVEPGVEMLAPANDVDVLVSLYRSVVAGESWDYQTELDRLQDEQAEMLETLAKIPTSAVRALAKVQDQIAENDQKISDVEASLSDVSDRFQEARLQAARLHSNWVRAADALESETEARRKAEALGQVVEKVIVTFRPSGKRNPVGYVERIEVVPAVETGSTEGFRTCELVFPKK